MTPCPETGRLARLDDVAGTERTALLEHVRVCAACRSRFASEDPTRLFALLALRPVPETTAGQVSAHAARTAEGRGPSPIRFLATGRAAAWAAAVLLALLAGLRLATPLGPGAFPPAWDRAAVPSGPRSGVEILSPPAVESVVDVTVGEVQLVMILDERMEL